MYYLRKFRPLVLSLSFACSMCGELAHPGQCTQAAAQAAQLPSKVSLKQGETIKVKVEAQVVDYCDMQRDPKSPECLSLIAPAAGEDTTKAKDTIEGKK